jgi:hypothetical protein
MKRAFKLAVPALAGALVLAGCGGSSTSNSSGASSAPAYGGGAASARAALGTRPS